MRVETWKSNKGEEEVHHFIDGTNTYLFGFNKKHLGKKLYKQVLELVKKELGPAPVNILRWDPLDNGR